MSMRMVVGDVVLSGTRTVTTASPAIDSGPGVADVLVMAHVTAAAGTSPTLVVSVEQSNDGATWTAVAGSATSALIAAGNAVTNAVVSQRFARIVATIGGGAPSFTFRAAVVVFAE